MQIRKYVQSLILTYLSLYIFSFINSPQLDKNIRFGNFYFSQNLTQKLYKQKNTLVALDRRALHTHLWLMDALIKPWHVVATEFKFRYSMETESDDRNRTTE